MFSKELGKLQRAASLVTHGLPSSIEIGEAVPSKET